MATKTKLPRGRALFRAVRLQLKRHPESYYYMWGCDDAQKGPRACIGGWALLLGFGVKRWSTVERRVRSTYISEAAAKLLGISDSDAVDLCIHSHRTAAEAVAVIDYYLANN